MRLDSSRALSASNSMDWGCSRWDAQSWTSICWYWESYLMRLQVVYTEALESSRLFRRKALNATQDKGALTVWFFRRLNWYPTTKKQSCKRGMVGAGSAGRMYRSDLHTSRWPAGSGRLAWVWKNKSMQNLSSSEGLPRCTCRRLRWGLDFLHCSVRESLVRRSPQKHRNRCLQLKLAERCV